MPYQEKVGGKKRLKQLNSFSLGVNFAAIVDYTLIMEQLLTDGVIMHFNL